MSIANKKSKNQTNQQNTSQTNQGPIKADKNLSTAELQEEKLSLAVKNARSKSRTADDLSALFNTTQGKTYATGILTALAVALLVFFAIRPAIGSINNQLDKNKTLLEKITQMNTKIESLNSLTQKKQQYSTELAKFNSYFSEDKHQGEIYDELMSLIGKTRLEFVSMNFSDVEGEVKDYNEIALDPKVKSQMVKISVLGSLSDANKLVELIEKEKRFYDIEEVLITTPEGSEESNDLQTEINMRTLYWGEAEEIY